MDGLSKEKHSNQDQKSRNKSHTGIGRGNSKYKISKTGMNLGYIKNKRWGHLGGSVH